MTRAALIRQLERHGACLKAMREFFDARGVVEVVTPSLSAAAATDPAIASIGCAVGSLGGSVYLHTSPEFAMKRLLAGGSGDIWQLARVYRDRELGRWHQPEFLLLEWYRLGFDEFALMEEVFELLVDLFGRNDRALTRLDMPYSQAFAAAFAVDPHALTASDARQLGDTLNRRGIDVPTGLSPDALLDLALTSVIVPSWPADTAVFLYDYPASQAALASIKAGPPPVAARFEVFVDGIELGNGFRELTDADEQLRRFESELATRRNEGLAEVPVDHELIEAMRRGLPECAGVAIGVERVLAVLSGCDELAAVIPLAHDWR